MEKLTEIWTMCLPYLITICSFIQTAIAPAVVSVALRRQFNKKYNRDFAEMVADIVIQKLNGAVFTHDILPVAESSMIKIEEHAREMVSEQMKDTKAQYLVILEVLKQLGSYFDNSIGVSDEQKEKLKQVIEVAEQSVLKKDVITTKVKPVEKKEKTIIER